MNYDPRDMACELYFRFAKPGDKDKDLRRLATRSCEMSDIFWQALQAYAQTKPQNPPPPPPPEHTHPHPHPPAFVPGPAVLTPPPHAQAPPPAA